MEKKEIKSIKKLQQQLDTCQLCYYNEKSFNSNFTIFSNELVYLQLQPQCRDPSRHFALLAKDHFEKSLFCDEDVLHDLSRA